MQGGGRISQELRETEKKASRQKHKAEEHNRDRKATGRHRQGRKVQTEKLKEIDTELGKKEAEQQGMNGEMGKQQDRWGPGPGCGDRGLTRTIAKKCPQRDSVREKARGENVREVGGHVEKQVN